MTKFAKNTTIVKYYDPRYDTTFKKVFMHPDLLISFLNALLPLGDDELIESIEYLSPEMVPKTPDGKFSIVDVGCKDRNGRQFIVEMQMVWSEEFRTRVLFNASKAYVRQLQKGEEYHLLKPVYSLNLVNDIFEPELPADEFYHFYQLVHERHTDKVIEGLHIVFIELPKFKPKNLGEKNMMELWLRFLTEINATIDQAPAELVADPLIGKAVSLVEESAMTPEDLLLYEKSLDNVRVEKAVVRSATTKGFNKGFDKGFDKGFNKGMNKGFNKGTLAVAKRMKANGAPIELITQYTGLSAEDIESL